MIKSLNQTSRKFNLSLVMLIALNLLPHLDEHTWIILIIGSLSLVWRFLYEYQKVRLPNNYIKSLLIAASVFIIYTTYEDIIGVEPFTALLIGAVSLKLIDNSKYHDAMVILFLNFILLMAKFLVSQSLSMTILGFVNVILITALLVQLHKGKDLQFNFLNLIKMGFRLMLQTAPLLILLFFVFPRYSVGFFGMNNKEIAESGFGASVEPGSISELVLSDRLAFRVEFKNKAPFPKDRYWKGAVLSKNNGINWNLKHGGKKRFFIPKPLGSHLIEQNIILEPQYETSLFALDTPVWIGFHDKAKRFQTYKSPGEVYSIKRNNGQKLNYTVLSQIKDIE